MINGLTLKNQKKNPNVPFGDYFSRSIIFSFNSSYDNLYGIFSSTIFCLLENDISVTETISSPLVSIFVGKLVSVNKILHGHKNEYIFLPIKGDHI